MLKDCGDGRASVEISGDDIRLVCKIDGLTVMVAELDPIAAIGLANSLLDAIHQVANESFGRC